MVALNPAYFAEKETPLIGGRVGDFYRSRAQNRVGDFFSETSNRVGSNEPVTLIVTIEITVYGYETASGVHNYLYANANPARFIDPSGKFGILDLAVTSIIVGYLSVLATQSIGNAPGQEGGLGRFGRTFARAIGFGDVKEFSGSLVISAFAAGPFLSPLLPFWSQGASISAALTLTSQQEICTTFQISGLVGAGPGGIGAGVSLGADAFFKDVDREGVAYVEEGVFELGLGAGVGLSGSNPDNGVSVGGGFGVRGSLAAFAGGKFGLATTGCARGVMAVPNATIRAVSFASAALWQMETISFNQ